MSVVAPESPRRVPLVTGLLSWLGATMEIARQSSVRLGRSKVSALMITAAVALGVLFSLVARRAAQDITGEEFYGIVAFMVMFQFGLPVLILYLGVVAVHGDIEDRTVTYLFVRPVRRSSLLLGKWLAVVLVGWLLAALGLVAIYVGVALPELDWTRGVRPDAATLGWYVVGAGMATASYAAVGVAFAAYFRRPLIAGGIFVVGWEFIVSHLPPQAGVRTATVADPIRRWSLEVLQPTGELRDMLERNLPHFGMTPEELGDPVVALTRFTVVMLLFALWVYGRREYDSRPRD